MKTKILTLLFAVCILSCNVKPESLTMGKDACHACKMTLMDEKFGAEIVTKKGKIYKFDDVNCMINFRNTGNEPEENIAYLLVVDFAHPENLIDATQTFYSKSDQIKSPMSSHVAAFEKKQDVEKFNAEWQGAVLTWSDLAAQFK